MLALQQFTMSLFMTMENEINGRERRMKPQFIIVGSGLPLNWSDATQAVDAIVKLEWIARSGNNLIRTGFLFRSLGRPHALISATTGWGSLIDDIDTAPVEDKIKPILPMPESLRSSQIA